MESIIQDIDGRVEIVSGQMDEFIRGWKKASIAKRKLLLKRVLQAVVVKSNEVKLIYWGSSKNVADLSGLDKVSGDDFESGSLQAIENAGLKTKKPSRDEKVLRFFTVSSGKH